jgi:hypothetical protein
VNGYSPTVSWVYFIRSEAGFIKVGKAVDVESRLAELQGGSPHTLTVLAVEPGGRALESALHKKFAGLRVGGEWFRDDLEIRAYISGLQAFCPPVRTTPRRAKRRVKPKPKTRAAKVANAYSKVIPMPHGCWHWMGATNADGVPCMPKGFLARRVLWKDCRGAITPSQCVKQMCGSRRCVNPHHAQLMANGEWYRNLARGDRNGMAKQFTPKRLSLETVTRMRMLKARGMSVRAIADEVGINRQVAGRILKHGWKGESQDPLPLAA